ncbi:hypothetical protein [Oceanirhabdus seepicola]|nr:hypothetical protein [Oceanirhabdus seepicola]
MSSLKEKGAKKRKPLMKTLKNQSDKKSVVSCKAVGPEEEIIVWP